MIHSAIDTKRPHKKNHIFLHHDIKHVKRRVVKSVLNKGWELFPNIIRFLKIGSRTKFMMTWRPFNKIYCKKDAIIMRQPNILPITRISKYFIN